MVSFAPALHSRPLEVAQADRSRNVRSRPTDLVTRCGMMPLGQRTVGNNLSAVNDVMLCIILFMTNTICSTRNHNLFRMEFLQEMNSCIELEYQIWHS
ncbi:hypothetical protein TNCT_147941 [Trichonephila clavata]|uniref:Uncharacterized protein n=1 Tax=Trichonephila clavata TaxID=2740835 RepID=A0A8X6FJY2_TRICU|nr:hypothetical protein TNCT_147941 [Trichonephila clavata]